MNVLWLLWLLWHILRHAAVCNQPRNCQSNGDFTEPICSSSTSSFGRSFTHPPALRSRFQDLARLSRLLKAGVQDSKGRLRTSKSWTRETEDLVAGRIRNCHNWVWRHQTCKLTHKTTINMPSVPPWLSFRITGIANKNPEPKSFETKQNSEPSNKKNACTTKMTVPFLSTSPVFWEETNGYKWVHYALPVYTLYFQHSTTAHHCTNSKLTQSLQSLYFSASFTLLVWAWTSLASAREVDPQSGTIMEMSLSRSKS